MQYYHNLQSTVCSVFIYDMMALPLRVSIKLWPIAIQIDMIHITALKHSSHCVSMSLNRLGQRTNQWKTSILLKMITINDAFMWCFVFLLNCKLQAKLSVEAYVCLCSSSVLFAFVYFLLMLISLFGWKMNVPFVYFTLCKSSAFIPPHICVNQLQISFQFFYAYQLNNINCLSFGYHFFTCCESVIYDAIQWHLVLLFSKIVIVSRWNCLSSHRFSFFFLFLVVLFWFEWNFAVCMYDLISHKSVVCILFAPKLMLRFQDTFPILLWVHALFPLFSLIAAVCTWLAFMSV